MNNFAKYIFEKKHSDLYYKITGSVILKKGVSL
jgi:hypothetical protein